jgi:hypothetical protein
MSLIGLAAMAKVAVAIIKPTTRPTRKHFVFWNIIPTPFSFRNYYIHFVEIQQ